MRLSIQLGSALLAFAVACGPRSVSEEQPTVVLPPPAIAAAPIAVELPDLEPLPPRRINRLRSAVSRLPPPTGLDVTRDGPPVVAVGPVDWDGPLIVRPPEAAVLVAHLERLDTQEATLAELARTRFELVRSLDAIANVVPVLDRRTRMRAGLRVCVLRRELEELERMQRGLQRDVVAFRELIAPAVRLAENR